ncbi:hypothetical protein GCM10017620_25840 [Brevundimonas intermedia]|uniref:Phage tail collar domain-containing protein n=1 Tax=Brevundimonas intermedia TaxID=74315 RepID=A0ABQ5TAH1_9CAUL|nr:tail fiber protein [Brevundimonas intermedia]GLK49611.1 hypothetical protein GCM10017620_25840 [Brevundimonas intermedia]
MAGLTITITDAGRAALPNGPNTGTSAVTISHVGVSNVHASGSLKALTTLPGEIKRVVTFGGDVVADDVIHITINDETADVYSVRAFGLYLSTGVLFAVFSAADVVVEKSANAMVLLSADITFKTLDTAVIEFGGTGFINPPATTDRQGVVELATDQETAVGTDASRAVTPKGLLFTLQSWATNFAAAVHSHSILQITGLDTALAGKSATGHKHDAADTITGVFDVARIPALAMAKITGLVAALADKSAIGHQHDAADVSSGVFNVGRIPALAMEKITGLATALAAKAEKINPAFTGGARISGPDAILQVEFRDDAARLAGFYATSGLIRLWDQISGDIAQFSSSGLGLRVAGVIQTVWHAGNFNPADKAAALHSHTTAQIGGLDGALAQRSLVGHGHGTGEIAGLDGALAARAVLGQVANFNDVTTTRGNGTGVIFLGDGAHYLYWDGANYNLNNGNLLVFGNPVLHTGNPDSWWPAGELKLFDTGSPPGGARLLVANGAEVSRSTYSRLYNAIGTRYGAGDGANTFNLPDWRGVFFRGLDNGRGLDGGRSLGVFQASQNLAHTHGLPVRDNADSGLNIEDAGTGGSLRSVNTYSEGGSEARPVNQALLACITY